MSHGVHVSNTIKNTRFFVLHSLFLLSPAFPPNYPFMDPLLFHYPSPRALFSSHLKDLFFKSIAANVLYFLGSHRNKLPRLNWRSFICFLSFFLLFFFLSFLFLFLDTTTYLYKRLCPCVRPSVRPKVGWSCVIFERRKSLFLRVRSHQMKS